MVHKIARQSITEWKKVWWSPDMFQIFFIMPSQKINLWCKMLNEGRDKKGSSTLKDTHMQMNRLTFKKIVQNECENHLLTNLKKKKNS